MANIKEIKNKKGISYQVDIRVRGYKRIFKTFHDPIPSNAKKEAKAWAAQVELQMQQKTYKENSGPENNPLKIVTMFDLIDYFQINIASKRYTYAEKYTVMYEWWKNQIGHIKVKELAASHLATAKQLLMSEKILRGKKLIVRNNNTVIKYLMCISAVLSWAVKELEIIDVNPMSKIDLPEKPNGRTRRLISDELPKITLACKEHSETTLIFFLLLLFTGGRYSEVLHLKAEEIDYKNSRVLYLNTKNKTHRSVGIDKKFLKFIKKYLEKNDIKQGYIFLNKSKDGFIYMRGIFRQIFKNLNIKDLHIHDLRHEFASTSAEEGASLLDIAVMLGHKSLVMARRYSHLTQKHTDLVAVRTANSMNIGKNIF